MRRPVARALERAGVSATGLNFPGVIRAYAHRLGLNPDARETLTELLADCRHWSDAKGHDFAAADRCAFKGLYLSEAQSASSRPAWFDREHRALDQRERRASQ